MVRLKILWEKPDTWECSSCNGRHFKVIAIGDFYIDYECLMCHQEDTMLRDDFIKFIREEIRGDKIGTNNAGI